MTVMGMARTTYQSHFASPKVEDFSGSRAASICGTASIVFFFVNINITGREVEVLVFF